MNLPLHGFRILDLSRLLPGPYATLLLSDLGAEVIRVEDPEHPDWLRQMPPLADDGIGTAFHSLNRGKKSVALRYMGGMERESLLTLVRTADVLVESFRPGVMENLRLSPEVLWQVQPNLLICRISGHGQQGPDQARAGHDLNFVARSGLLSLSEKPQLPPIPIADICGGAWPAALQICAHLVRRDDKKPGVVLDINMLLHTYANVVLARGFRGDEREQERGLGTLNGALPSYGIYPTRDGNLAIAALEPKFWNRFVAAIGEPELADRGWAQDAEGQAVRSQLSAALKMHTTAEWEDKLRPLDLCVEPVRQADKAETEDPQLSYLRQRAINSGSGDGPMAFSPIFGWLEADAKGPALGADNESVLGRSESETIAR